MTDHAQPAAGRQDRDGLVAELNRVLDALAVTRPGADLLESGRLVVHRLAGQLEALPTLPDNPCAAAYSPDNVRLQPSERGLVPTLHIRSETDRELTGRVVFSPRFAGTAAVHGGAISLFFDDFLGRLANHSSVRTLARTAYLHIDFRHLTPLSTELLCDAWVERAEGRKRVLRGTVRHDEKVVAQAEGLWIESRHHQKES
jgi:acyl-coenzyme A thioesterase PaaI-like protein